MFRIMVKHMNIHELRALTKLWGRMIEMFESEFCIVDHEDCKYKRLCRAFYDTNTYLNKVLIQREKEEAGVNERLG